ncbi:DNA-protecting protein DprA, partial [bacterium]|nr:DNA-protecting protein DprA [bacterium]
MKICSSVLWHLSLTDGVGPATAIRLLKSVCGLLLADLAEASQFKLDLISKIFSFSAHDFVMRCGLSQRAAEACVRGLADASLLHSEGELALRHGVHVVTLADAEYPQLLRNIHRPPIVLYIKGAKLKETPSIAVVGTRRANHYARRALELVVPELAASGWSVVSGGAVGVDTVAHELAIECRGHTAVVLGSGLLRPYPSTNKKLFESVVARGGSVVSPFPLEARPEKGNFPARNRVVAGLAKSCLVVQAPGRSGALITASYALAENRDVYAVPGAVDDVLSQGCHDLIRQ